VPAILLSSAITKLQALFKEHGDLPLYSGEYELDIIEFKEGETYIDYGDCARYNREVTLSHRINLDCSF